jgi:hypothetical protein
MDPKDKPVSSISEEKREEVWDDVFAKEEGLIIDVRHEYKHGQGSIEDGSR